jgi:hypothetical protein
MKTFTPSPSPFWYRLLPITGAAQAHRAVRRAPGRENGLELFPAFNRSDALKRAAKRALEGA